MKELKGEVFTCDLCKRSNQTKGNEKLQYSEACLSIGREQICPVKICTLCRTPKNLHKIQKFIISKVFGIFKKD